MKLLQKIGKLNKPININAKDDDDDDNNGGSGVGGGRNVLNRNSRRPDPSPAPPDEIMQRFNEISYGPIPSSDEIMQRFKKLRYNTGTANIRPAPKTPSFQLVPPVQYKQI